MDGHTHTQTRVHDYDSFFTLHFIMMMMLIQSAVMSDEKLADFDRNANGFDKNQDGIEIC